jgi:hypothetical protein
MRNRRATQVSDSPNALRTAGASWSHRERLLDHDFVGEIPVEPRVADIAGNEYRPDFRALGARPFEKLDSRHSGH